MADRARPHGLLAGRVTSRPHSSPRPAGGGCAQGGFSLLEVVVAFAILALSLGLLLQIFSRALHTTALSGDYSRAATLAQARLNAVGVDIPLELGSYGGDAPDDFFWQVSITPYEFGDSAWEPPLDAFLVTSVVSWNGKGDNQRRISLTSLRLADPSAGTDPGTGMAPPAKFADKTR